MVQSGKTDLLTISRLGGWASLEMLTRYAKQNKEDLKKNQQVLLIIYGACTPHLHHTASAGEGMSVRDIQETLQELYGVDVSPTTLSAITDKVWDLVGGMAEPLAGEYLPNYLSGCDPHQAASRRQGREYCRVYRPGRFGGQAALDEFIGLCWINVQRTPRTFP